MKRWSWLLVLPWALMVSKEPDGDFYRIEYKRGGENWLEASEPCQFQIKEACQDLVDALNEAHAWREEDKLRAMEGNVDPDAPLTADEKEFLRKGHLEATGQIKTLTATATTSSSTVGCDEEHPYLCGQATDQ